MQHSSSTDREVTATTPAADADRSTDAEAARTATTTLGAIVEPLARVRDRYVTVTDETKARLQPVAETLRRAQLRFLAATDRWKQHAAALPRDLHRWAKDPDGVERLRRRLGGVGIALFAILAVGSLALLKPAGRSSERHASGRGSSDPTTTSTEPDPRPPTTRSAPTSPSTTIPGAFTAPQRSSRVPASRALAASSVASRPPIAPATGGPSGSAGTTPAAPPAPITGTSVLSTSPTTVAPTGSTPTTAAVTTTTPGTSPTPASPPARLLTFDLVLGGDELVGTVCVLGIDLLGGGACERGR